LLYTEGTMSSGFFLKKVPPSTPPDSEREWGTPLNQPNPSDVPALGIHHGQVDGKTRHESLRVCSANLYLALLAGSYARTIKKKII
jgi:hypothetical protein